MAEPGADNVPARATPAGGKPPLFGLSFLENLSEMTMLRQVGLLVGLAASVAIGFAVVLWSQQPDYRPLYGSLAGMDAKQVMDTLAAADIAYSVEPNSGALLVKAEDLSRARLKLAGAGVTPSDGNIGFEILDKDQGLGTSQFMEATRYRRGLEGELARTISSLNNVKGARVHLAIPKSSVFVRDERKPSASVLIELYSGRSLEPGQVLAIINLVATSVPELSTSQVTVVDQNGNMLAEQAEFLIIEQGVRHAAKRLMDRLLIGQDHFLFAGLAQSDARSSPAAGEDRLHEIGAKAPETRRAGEQGRERGAAESAECRQRDVGEVGRLGDADSGVCRDQLGLDRADVRPPLQEAGGYSGRNVRQERLIGQRQATVDRTGIVPEQRADEVFLLVDAPLQLGDARGRD
jgi:type III secretory pathway lipoprotein EscJ